MSSILHEKPMSKRSNFSRGITESLRWWEEGISSYGEWAYEGGPEF